MNPLFDAPIDRSNTEATKWEHFREAEGLEDILPMWIADMDFATAEPIAAALRKRAEHPVYGYSDRGAQYYDLFARRFSAHYGYGVTGADVVLSTGVVYSISAAIRCFTAEDDGIIIPMPAYHPFMQTTEDNHRRVVPCPMEQENGRWELNWALLEEQVMDSRTTMLLLCSPHNPTGRVFSKAELTRLAELCQRGNVLVVADEIHCDFVYAGTSFVPFCTVNDWARQHSISCVSPTKSFNLAGLKISAALIPNQKLCAAFRSHAALVGISSINVMAMEAVKAAYCSSEDWLRALTDYLQENRDFALHELHHLLPEVGLTCPEGTYFLWMDMRKSTVPPEKIHDTLLRRDQVALNEGSTFGKDYLGFERLNFACPRSQLTEAIRRMALR